MWNTRHIKDALNKSAFSYFWVMSNWIKWEWDCIIHCANWFNFRVKLIMTSGKSHTLGLFEANEASSRKTRTFFQNMYSFPFSSLSCLFDDAGYICDVTVLLLFQHTLRIFSSCVDDSVLFSSSPVIKIKH